MPHLSRKDNIRRKNVKRLGISKNETVTQSRARVPRNATTLVAFILEQTFDSSAIEYWSRRWFELGQLWLRHHSRSPNQALITKIKWKITGLPSQTKVKYEAYLTSTHLLQQYVRLLNGHQNKFQLKWPISVTYDIATQPTTITTQLRGLISRRCLANE